MGARQAGAGGGSEPATGDSPVFLCCDGARCSQLDLISHGLTEALRAARFPADEPLTPAGRAAPADRAFEPPADTQVPAGPERRTSETARLLGLDATPDSRLRDLDAGAWRGAELAALGPAQLHGRRTDPATAPSTAAG
ncbi:histidine phosphatase family protein [Nocardia carnea]|uniref:histidine phosphatase family protein n=1 Tax=Nocardia carnea TaxID=37328 RepID=UPI002455D43C|nr:histidine phosphatase family protein [Nocardia carnea]